MRRSLQLMVLFLLPLGTIACQQATVRGPAGQRLTVMKPSDVTVHRGAADDVDVMLKKQNIPGTVTLTVSNLPDGVEAVDQPRRTSSKTVSITLRARQDADLVENHAAKLTAEGPDNMKVTQHFRISVEP
jgi:hypothetical protein